MRGMTQTLAQFDVIVIGAGIAGVGLAAQLGADLRVVVLEQEAQPGYHTTGRSAAVFAESYGGATVRLLSRGSRGFFMQPPPGFANDPLLTRAAFCSSRETISARHWKRSPVSRTCAAPARA
jgi:D-arginine dehydrogenase